MSRREGGKPFASTLGYLLRLLERLSTLFPVPLPHLRLLSTLFVDVGKLPMLLAAIVLIGARDGAIAAGQCADFQVAHDGSYGRSECGSAGEGVQPSFEVGTAVADAARRQLDCFGPLPWVWGSVRMRCRVNLESPRRRAACASVSTSKCGGGGGCRAA